MEGQSRRRHGLAIFDGQPAVHETLKQAWYKADVDSIPPKARDLLEQYSGLKSEEVIPHVIALVRFYRTTRITIDPC